MADQTLVVLQLGLAVATTLTSLALVWFTYVLARHTQRMADNTSSPHVVAALEPNKWTLLHFDLAVENTGNATAYDINVRFEPKLPTADIRGDVGPPLETISVLRPGHRISSYAVEYAKIQGQVFKVAVSWKASSTGPTETSSYTIRVADFDSISQLGTDPAIQLAEQVKKLREEWSHIATGHRRIAVDVYTQADRDTANARQRERMDEARARRSGAGG